MQRDKRILLACVIAFVLIEAVLGVLVQTLSGSAVVWASWAVVLLACAFCVLFYEPTPRYALTQLALVCTVCADFFLVVHPEQPQFVAMLFFSVTQLSYFARLYVEENSQKKRAYHVAARVTVSLLSLLVTWLVLRENTDKVVLISLFYFSNLLLNIVFAFIGLEKPGLFAIGLVLFALCDVFVGLSLMEGYLPITEGSFIYALAHPGFNLAWVFYVPSQALLALSLLPCRLQQIHKKDA